MALNVGELSQTVTVEGTVSVAAEMAPSQSTLEARSAKSEISPEFVQNFASPVADYTELLNMAPGTFSVNPNGVGLGDSKTYFRGFADGQYTMTVDGIPFNDTNTPTHHSWAFFPSQFIAGIDFDRSPGSASTIGPTNFGGSINMLSRSVPYGMDIRATGDVRLLQHPHARVGSRFRAVRRQEQEIELRDQPAPDVIGRISDL